jgi:hypothetical protein
VIADLQDNLIQRWVVKLRWPIFVLVGLILLAAHNGNWRLGRDSSLYRAVADNLASGRGYTFRGQREHHIYPGLPYLLAGIDKIFGRQDPIHPRAALWVMFAISILTLVVVYQLVKTYFPPWIAVAVTTGVGINHEFLQQTHELMTDLPFLFGVCTTLLGIARLPKATTKAQRAIFIIVTLAGAMITVTMRPTFWALLLAFIGACFIGMLHSRRRMIYLAGLVVAVALVLTWIAVDPRTSFSSLAGGRYEQKVISTLKNLGGVKWRENLGKLSTERLPEFFFGLEMPMPWGPLVCTIVLAFGVLLVRKSPLWGLYILVTAAMVMVLGGAVRYYLMVLPLLLVGWANFAKWIADISARWYSSIPYAGDLVMLFWLGLATGPHLIRDSGFIFEQHGYAKDHSYKGFYEVYRGGTARKLIAVSNAVRQRSQGGDMVIGFEPRITSYLSGRKVFSAAELLKGLKQGQWSRALRKSNPKWIFYEKTNAKREASVLVSKLFRNRVLVSVAGSETTMGSVVLAKITVQNSIKRPKPATKPAATRPASTTRRATTRQSPH